MFDKVSIDLIRKRIIKMLISTRTLILIFLIYYATIKICTICDIKFKCKQVLCFQSIIIYFTLYKWGGKKNSPMWSYNIKIFIFHVLE